MSPNIRGSRRPLILGDPVVTQSHLHADRGAPLVIQAVRSGTDLGAWATANTALVETEVSRHGAVLFRGFDVNGAGSFEAAAGALAPSGLFGDYGDLPRQSAAGNVFLSTPYPDELSIHIHNESSHLATWPLRIFFHCAVPAQAGGETPLLDGRRAVAELDRALIGRLERHGLSYIRNFSPGIDVSWQSFFGTSDRAAVEARGAGHRRRCEWLGPDELRVVQGAAAVQVHPRTGERVLFNQLLLHHPAALPPATRQALDELYPPDRRPRHVTYGDGTEIEDDVVAYLIHEYERRSIRFPWDRGDVLMLDNMLMAHGRAPFAGPRQILVAMSEMTESG